MQSQSLVSSRTRAETFNDGAIPGKREDHPLKKSPCGTGEFAILVATGGEDGLLVYAFLRSELRHLRFCCAPVGRLSYYVYDGFQ